MTEVIKFEVKDWEYPDLEKIASDLAQFIHNHKSFLEHLNTFMRVSAKWWERGIENSEFQKWLSKYMPNRKKAAADKIQFVDMLAEVKEVCETSEDWDKMRGLIPEKVFEIYFTQKHQAITKEFGAQVLIYNIPVIYYHQTSEEGNPTRRTVDAGSWNGTYGEFAEVKFLPDGFKEKDIGYLNLLEKRLDTHKVSHAIFLVTFDTQTAFVKRMLESKGFLPKNSRFQILGGEDIIASN